MKWESSKTKPGGRPLVLQPLVWVVNGVLELADYVLGPLQQLIGTRRMAWFFVLPNLLIFSIFILLPMLLNFYYGFTAGNSVLPENRAFVGTANIEKILNCADYTDPNTCDEDLFWRGVSNTGLYVVSEVTLIVLFSLATALALNRRIIARGFFRSVFFYPVLLSPVVVALVWQWMLRQDGLLNALIVGLGGERIPFLLDATWSRFWVVVIGVWAQMGFYTLILLAGLQAIPRELYEAGAIDGAGHFQSFRNITLPLLMPTLLVVMVLAIIRAVQVFDHVFVLTNGGPGTATLFIVHYIYRTAFSSRNWGLAAAASLLLAIVLLLLTASQFRLNRRSESS
jgi:alpha-1,4-digalacturonate transport system permease protein